MARNHPHGFFVCETGWRAATLSSSHQNVMTAETLEFEDPYRFPPLLSAFDLHLHGEGTHYETYNMLGSHLVAL